MTYFTGNLDPNEKHGLLSPRKSTDDVKQVAVLNTLRFLAVVHFIAGRYFVGHEHANESFYRELGRNLKTWGFTQINFLVLLSGFVLAHSYAGQLTDNYGPGYSLKKFLIKRACWLYPVYLIAIFLRVWAEPTTFLGRIRDWAKFAANAGCLAGFWPPAFRTYHVNDVAWAGSIFVTMYIIIMPLFLKPVHKSLSRDSRKWLLVFMWPWTMFIGFIVERFDTLVGDGTTHWDWVHPIFYIPSFLMGMTAGCIFVERPEETLVGLKEIIRRFGGTGLFLLNFIIMSFADVDPMYHWHQIGSLSLLQVFMIYCFASGKDLILGKAFAFKGVRLFSGWATSMFIMQSAVSAFAQQIDWRYDATFWIALLGFTFIMRYFVEIPYARWTLTFLDSKEK